MINSLWGLQLIESQTKSSEVATRAEQGKLVLRMAPGTPATRKRPVPAASRSFGKKHVGFLTKRP